jgi:DNA polymerase III subunit gamma/tau
MTEGHNPSHVARQLVRLLRNVLVAKVAGSDSALLQISADERARAGRIAAEFSEEDLARFLQIMLRTYDELGYRQEQRFHLELGVLKLVHAQRLLPLEELLSQVGAPVLKPAETTRKTTASSPMSDEPAGPERAASPFEADRARKGRSFDPEMTAGAGVQLETMAPRAVALAEAPDPSSDAPSILTRVLAALENSGHHNLMATMETGQPALHSNELVVTIDQPAPVIPFIMSAEQKRIAGEAATNAAGRPLKVSLAGSPGKPPNGSAVVRPPGDGGSARGRAADDPVVRRMQEKFGAEIRTVIDHRAKN